MNSKGYDVVWFGRQVTKLQMNLLPPSTRFCIYFCPKMQITILSKLTKLTAYVQNEANNLQQISKYIYN